MKKIALGVLIGAAIVFAFYLIKTHGNPSVGDTQVQPLDSSSNSIAGNPPGTQPKTVIIVKCATKDCFGSVVTDTTAVPPGSLESDVTFTLQEALPAKSEIHLKVYQTQLAGESSKDKR